MLNTLSSRATFYDVIGYLVPGVIFLGIGWLYWYQFIDDESAKWIVKHMLKNVFVTSLAIVAIGYVLGHLVNAVSSLLLEKCLFKKPFANAKKWYERALEKNPTRASAIQRNVDLEFHVAPADLTTFDMRIRMEEMMPNATITGFSFLSFYGMSRTLALLAWLSSLPLAFLIGMRYEGGVAIFAALVAFIASCAVGAFFCYQYLRFVEYYYDFLGSTLLRSKACGND